MTTLERLENGVNEISRTSQADVRWNYYKGKHTLPFAPRGVNQEYMELRKQARVPLIRLALRLPVQRLRLGGIRSGIDGATDTNTWKAYNKNKLATKSRTLYTHALALGYGVVSVWRGEEAPVIKVEDPSHLYLHFSEEDPDVIEYVVKSWMEGEVEVAYLYEPDTITRYERLENQSYWTEVFQIENELGRVPFVLFAPERDADGTCNSVVDALIPMQQAIDTMRFNLLLAAQFAAFRQRVIVGYDPVLRDDEGQVIPKTDEHGNPVTDKDGNVVPLVAPSPQVGVDRFLAFAGENTKVFEMQESDLTNYNAALDQLINVFASVAQVPAQYLIGEFKNVSGDLMTATEATLRSFVYATQQAFSDSWREVWELASLAQGEDYATEVIWMDAAPKSLAEIADATSKMVPNGAPINMFLAMLDNADQTSIDKWVADGKNALGRAMSNDLAAQFGDA